MTTTEELTGRGIENGTGEAHVLKIDGKLRFTVEGRPESYAVDLIAAHEKLRQIVDGAKGQPPYWHLGQLGEWLNTKHGRDLGFELGDLDQIWHKIQVKYLERKKSQSDELASIQRLLSSTDSVPEN